MNRAVPNQMLSVLIIAFGLPMILTGIIITVKAELLTSYPGSNMDKPGLYWTAILARLLLGCLMVLQSEHSRLPATTGTRGWLQVIAAFGLMTLGQSKFEWLVAWVMKTIAPFVRIATVLAPALGGFLIYAFICNPP